MAKLTETFNMGSTKDLTMEELVNRLLRMYTDIAQAVNQKVDLVEREVDGQTSDTFLAQGTVNINTLTNKVEMLTNHPTQTTVTWTTLS